MSPRPSRRVALIAVAASAASLGAFWKPSRLPSPFVPVAVVVGATAGQTAQDSDPTVVRSRVIALDFASLPGTVGVDGVPAISLDLFDDVRVVAAFDRFDPNTTGVTWVGHVENLPGSVVTLVYDEGVMVGTVQYGRRVFSIRPASEAIRAANPNAPGPLHVVAEVDQSAFLPEAPPVVPVIGAGDIAAAADEPMRDTADFVDVMVVYTTTAMNNLGGATTMNNLINLAISESNTSYANSSITQRLRLVHSEQVNYTEVSSFSTNLNNLRGGVGALSGIPALRDLHRADLVTMLVDPPSPDACGIAFVMLTVSTAFAPNGYSVTDTSCVSPNYTFAHELGHNMGAQHDWYMSSATLPFTYAHGYVNHTQGQRWRTVMAYPDHCTAQGFSCTRLLQWANPQKKRNSFCSEPGNSNGVNCSLTQFWYSPGIPMGVPQGTSTACVAGRISNPNCDADDARTLNNTALTIANLRQVSADSRGVR